MGLAFSTQLGPPGNGCQSPANNSALLVTLANGSSAGATDYNTNTRTYLKSNTRIRCTDEGELKTLLSIISRSGVTLPTGGSLVTVDSNIKIKRPNCECTILETFKCKHTTSGTSTSNINSLGFSDGYNINLGRLYYLLKIGTSGLEFTTAEDLVVGEFVASCQSPGRTTDISSGCTKITSKSQTATIDTGETFFCRPETSYPQDEFPTSEIRSAIMLENGVYIFTIPDGGDY
tara:strand:- start:3991 stop:4689 length:699 start_codon:yes stop_codon:yes gene_type:complete